MPSAAPPPKSPSQARRVAGDGRKKDNERHLLAQIKELQRQLDEVRLELESWERAIERRAERYAAGRPRTLTAAYAAHLQQHEIPRNRSVSLAPQVTTPQN